MGVNGLAFCNDYICYIYYRDVNILAIEKA